MTNTIYQGAVSIALFIALLFGLNQIDWVTLLNVEQNTEKTEEKLGDLLWESIGQTETENTDSFVVNTIDSIVSRICTSNLIEREHIKIHILQKDEVNAFALPNGHLVVYSGLILAADNQEELSGVICHELAHIQLNHVMKKLIREVGLSVLVSMTTGSGGSEMIKETAKMLSSSAFDRSLEKEADIQAVDYLITANIDPIPFADFLFKLSKEEPEMMQYFSWASTHPELKERAGYIMDHSRGRAEGYEPVLSKETWELLQGSLNTF